MPIDKSSPWGEEVTSSGSEFAALPTCGDEQALARMLTPTSPPEVRMTGGDFVDLTGGVAAVSGATRRYPCDVLEVRGPNMMKRTIGTVELRRRRSRVFGGFLILSNLGVRGAEHYSARAHPNDGKFEVVDALGGLTWRERVMLSRRFTRGGDFSHPLVRQKQATSHSSQVPLHVYVDGVYCGRGAVEVEIRPDFLWIRV